PTSALKNLIVYPAQVQLDGPRSQQHLGVLGEYAEGRSWDLSGSAAYSSSNPAIARVDGGVIQPVGDGQAVITVKVAGQTKTIPVQVKNAAADLPVEFTREVTPVL